MKWGKIDAKILIFTRIKQIRPLFYRLKRKFLISNIIGMVHREITIPNIFINTLNIPIYIFPHQLTTVFEQSIIVAIAVRK